MTYQYTKEPKRGGGYMRALYIKIGRFALCVGWE